MEDLSSGSLEYENAHEILKAGIRGSDLVKQILTFSRQTEHKMMPVRVQQILKEALKLSRASIPMDIQITHTIDPGCGFVMADPSQLHQIVMNLVTNAYHAVEATGGEIIVSLKENEILEGGMQPPSLPPGPYAVLSVSDTGSGIEPTLLDQIFEPYFTTKEMGKGTGLGLAVVYGIVIEHHGDIKVYSQVGKGSTFDVFLPLMEKAMETKVENGSMNYQTGHERILLVEDVEAVAVLERQMLERLGYRVESKTDSMDALNLFRSDPEAFDLVITDMTMPNLTGDKLAGELISIRPNIPVIICTGFSERINREKALSIGIKGFLPKPVLKPELSRIVRKVMDEAKRDDECTCTPCD
jgi:CheY-like chemotaxis protein